MVINYYRYSLCMGEDIGCLNLKMYEGLVAAESYEEAVKKVIRDYGVAEDQERLCGLFVENVSDFIVGDTIETDELKRAFKNRPQITSDYYI